MCLVLWPVASDLDALEHGKQDEIKHIISAKQRAWGTLSAFGYYRQINICFNRKKVFLNKSRKKDKCRFNCNTRTLKIAIDLSGGAGKARIAREIVYINLVT